MKDNFCFNYLAALTFLVFISLSFISSISLSQEFSEEALIWAMKELELAHLNSVSKEVDGTRVYFDSKVPYAVDINQVVNINFNILSDHRIKQLDWNVELLIYRNKKLLSTLPLVERDSTKNSSAFLESSELDFESNVRFDEAGNYVLVVEANTVDMKGVDIRHKTINNILVQQPLPISLTGEIIDSLVDTNENGLADKLKVVLPFEGSIQSDEKYVVSVELGNAQFNGIRYTNKTIPSLTKNNGLTTTLSEKNYIAYGKDIVDSSDNAIVVEFDGKDIAKKHKIGKLRIVNLRISPFELGQMKSSKKIPFLGETQSYSYKQFERKLITVHQEEADISFVDQDLNGIYEGLNIRFDVSVVLDSRYKAFMNYGTALNTLFRIEEYFELSEGTHEINIFIPAQTLVNTETNGNTPLTSFHFRNANTYDWTAERRNIFGVSPGFTCEDFGDCTIRRPKPIRLEKGNYH